MSAPEQPPPGASEAYPQAPAEPGQRCNMQAHLTRLFGTDLTLIPGIGDATALVLFSELGSDLSRFPSASQFASWLNLCPQNKITGGRVISSKTGPGVNRAAQVLRMATQTLYRSQSALGTFAANGLASATPQAITDTAHKMARIIYHLVTRHVLYDDNLLAQQQRQDRKRHVRRLRNQARALGFQLVPEAA